MSNADKIRSMTDEQLQRFLWTWKVNSIESFLESGGQKIMDAKETEIWIKDDASTFLCTETMVGENFTFDQDFVEKEQ